jgi:uncharacterized membrane protein
MSETGLTLEALRSVPMFASLDDAAAKELRRILEPRSVPRGTRLFRHGESGDAMYLIESGRVRISLRDEAGDVVTLAELGEGDFFGEMALIDGAPRSADAETLDDSRVAVLRRAEFLSFVRSNPDVALEILSAVTQRLRRTDDLLRSRASRNANEEEEARATLADRLADRIADFGGSWKFIGASVALVVVWVGLSFLHPSGGFDPAPWPLLNLMLVILAAVQAPIILMSQNRQQSNDRLRADLDYRVNLKNELALAELMRRLEVLENERLPKLLETLGPRPPGPD